jgi:hypothetical protein
MKDRIIFVVAASLLVAGLAAAQQKPAPSAASKVNRTADGHPDLSGNWTYAIDLAPIVLKKVTEGKVTTTALDQSARHRAAENVPGALPWTKAPSYKAEFQAKVSDLAAHESKVDGVFYCGRPGVPRIGSPRRIIQLRGELIFLYEEISGDIYRIIPTDGRKHRADANPSYYGDAVGHWDGDTFVVDVTNFTDDTWMWAEGRVSFHSDALHIVERYRRVDANTLEIEATVEDPKVLTGPWTVPKQSLKLAPFDTLLSLNCATDETEAQIQSASQPKK